MKEMNVAAEREQLRRYDRGLGVVGIAMRALSEVERARADRDEAERLAESRLVFANESFAKSAEYAVKLDFANHEVKLLRAALAKAATCTSCGGTGEYAFVVEWKYDGPNEPEEITEVGTCPECDGSKIGSHIGDDIRSLLKGKT